MIYDYGDRLLWQELLPALESGQIFVYPTDTIYGLGARADSRQALEKLYQLKRRPAHMPLSMLVPDVDAVRGYALLTKTAETIARHFLPGALTMVLPALNKRLPEMLYSDTGDLGFRIPDHPFCHNLMRRTLFPVVSSSVNYSGEPALHKMSDIEAAFASEVRLMIRDKALDQCINPSVSTVIRIDRNKRVRLLREGLIPFSEIMRIAGD